MTRDNSECLTAALEYASRGWPVFPVKENKAPYTQRGSREATTDEAIIRKWWTRWPNALASIITGEPSRVVAVDVDVRPGCSGFDTLEKLTLTISTTPKALTPSGGIHLLFQWPGIAVRTGRLGPGLEFKGDKGSLILPPGPGRKWIPEHGLDEVELAALPEHFTPRPQPPSVRKFDRPHLSKVSSALGRVILNDAASKIRSAPDGSQECTLNAQAYRLGICVAKGVLPHDIALDVLLWAARQMRSYDLQWPWRLTEIETKVRGAFADGLNSNHRFAG